MGLIRTVAASEGSSFQGPSIDEFFPQSIFSIGGFEVNRIILWGFVFSALLIVFLVVGTRRMKVVPGRFQSTVELLINVPRVNVAEDVLGKKEGRRFSPLITTIFFLVLSLNIIGIIPFVNVARTSIIGMPLVLAAVAWIAFIYAGVRKSPGGFFKNALFPPGVPWPLYIIVTPIEFVSTFILRPVTLTLRLLMNMIVGHLLLVLFFSASSFFIFNLSGFWTLFGLGTFAFGFVFTLFEMLVAVLQAYVFALLTAVYIQLAVAEEH